MTKISYLSSGALEKKPRVLLKHCLICTKKKNLVFHHCDENFLYMICIKCLDGDTESKPNINTQQPGEKPTYKGEVDCTEVNTTSGFGSGGTEPKNPPAEIYNHQTKQTVQTGSGDGPVVCSKRSGESYGVKTGDSSYINKTSCQFSIDGKCTGKFSPLSCDGYTNYPEECSKFVQIAKGDEDVS